MAPLGRPDRFVLNNAKNKPEIIKQQQDKTNNKHISEYSDFIAIFLHDGATESSLLAAMLDLPCTDPGNRYKYDIMVNYEFSLRRPDEVINHDRCSAP